MPPNETLAATLRWQAELDQMLTGLRRRDPKAVKQARTFLALLARDGTTHTLTCLFTAIAAGWEAEPLTEGIP